MVTPGIQVAFLLDGGSSDCQVTSNFRSLSLACAKILFSLSNFPRKKCLKWKYVILKENQPAVSKVPPFMELKLECMERLFKELRCELEKNTHRSMKILPMSVLSHVLADVVHGSVWDLSDIHSPSRGHVWPGASIEGDSLNIVFVHSRCTSREEVVFSDDLHTCLLKQNITVFWMSGLNIKMLGNKISPIERMSVEVSSFFEPLPQPSSAIYFHRAKEGSVPNQTRNGCGNSESSEYFWFCNNTSFPLCVIKIEPLLTPTPHCVFSSRIRGSSVKNKFDSLSNLQLNLHDRAKNYAVIAGVLREGDTSSCILESRFPYSATSFGVPCSSLDGRMVLEQNPLEALEGTKRFSSEYQNLCVKLASKRLLLLLKVTTNFGDTGWCVLQPVSSVMSSIFILNPSWATTLAARVSTSCNVDFWMGMIDPFVLEQRSLKCVSYPELYCNIKESSGGKEESDKHTRGEVFTVERLFPWYPFCHLHGVSCSNFQLVKDLQKGVKHRRRMPGVITGGKLIETVSFKQEEYEVKKAPTSSAVDGTDEVITLMKADYEEQVRNCVECLKLKEWASSNLCKLKEKIGASNLFSRVSNFLLRTMEQLVEKYAEGNHVHEEKIAEYILQVFLRLEVDHLCGENLSEHDVSHLAIEVTRLLRKISMMATPAFLGQSMKEVVLPWLPSTVATLILVTDEGSQRNRLVTKVSNLQPLHSVWFALWIFQSLLCFYSRIAVIYSATCQKMLLSVYEGLLLPVPVELGESPTSSPPEEGVEESPTSSAGSNSRNPLLHQSSTPLKTVPTHSLTRHASFQDPRQIVIPTQKMKVKKGEAFKRTSDGYMGKIDQEGRHENDQSSEQVPRKVCRTLFKRSMSLNADIGCKRQRDEVESSAMAKRNKVDIVVKETPVKKQVDNYRQYKLRRLRSKMDASDSLLVDVIEESPRRSFYSSKAPMKLKSTPSLSSMKTLLQGTSTAVDTEHTLSSTTLYEPTCSSFETENPLTEREFAKTQESTGLCSTQPTFCHDPSVLEESPSMVAFSLSTPTKDDPVSFENALKRL